MGDSKNVDGNARVWLARAGRHGQDESTALEEGLAIVGFHQVPDLTNTATKSDILEIVNRAFPDAKKGKRLNIASQLGAFALRMQEGDIVALPLKTDAGKIALGRVSGAYGYRELNGEPRHVRPVQWVRTDISRTDLMQDLLYSLGAFMTVCRITRNDAERRFRVVIDGGKDPGAATGITVDETDADVTDEDVVGESTLDIAQIAHDQIISHIQSRFAGHDLARLVDAVLRADGYTTKLSPPGPDGGVDILVSRGTLGLDGPKICVQVKSSSNAADVTVFRALQGTMQTFQAEQGLLVSWGGFKKPLQQEAHQSFFSVRLWNSTDLVEALYRVYDRLDEAIQAELPLKRVWTLVPEADEE